MEVKLDVYINDSETKIQFDDNKSMIKISDANNFDFNISNQTLYLLLNENNIKYVGQIMDENIRKELDFNKVISIISLSELNLEYLEYSILKEAIEKQITLVNKEKLKEPKIPENQISDINEYKDKILFILKSFGYDLFRIKENEKTASKPASAKARHKWTKEIGQIKFTAKLRGGKGEAIWRKKDELVLLSGAKLVVDPQLNKDGSLNFSAQFAQKLRSDYIDKVENNITTEDIVFQSPNQLGLFLFYGGQNTWAELKDSNGKSLDDWSRVD